MKRLDLELETTCRDIRQRWWILYQDKNCLSDPLKRRQMLQARLHYQKCRMEYLILLTNR